MTTLSLMDPDIFDSSLQAGKPTMVSPTNPRTRATQSQVNTRVGTMLQGNLALGRTDGDLQLKVPYKPKVRIVDFAS